MSLVVDFVPSPFDERLLRAFGIKYTVEDREVVRWDAKASLALNARPTPGIDQEVVQEIAAGVRDGSPMEMPVTFDIAGTNRYVAEAGNHRMYGLRQLEVKTVRCYVIAPDTDPGLIQQYERAANSRAVKTLSRREKAELARHYVEVCGWTAKQAAAKVALPVDYFSDYLRARVVENRMRKAGVRSPDNIAEQVKRKILAVCGNNDKRFDAATRFAIAANVVCMPGGEVCAVLDEAHKKSRSDDEFLAALTAKEEELRREEEERRQAAVVKSPPRPVRTKVLNLSKGLHRIIADVKYAEGLQLNAIEGPELLSRVEEIRDKLKKLFAASRKHGAAGNGRPAKGKAAAHRP
jgi:hypothetical protein